MLVHSIIFDNKMFSTTDARKWLSRHGYKPIKKVDVTLHYYRYRIRDPKLFKSFITKEVTPGIKFVFGIS